MPDATAAAGGASYRLDARYDDYDSEVQLTGIQAIARTVLESRRADLRAGIDTAGFVSGYPGSPLAGLDLEFGRVARRMAELGIVHQAGVNEELAATAVFGSQLVQGRHGATVDGVTGWWYGKAPGVDRAADALRHGNYAGTGHRSGVVVLAGDDPSAKSSSLPSASETALFDAMLPILAPGTVAEIGELGAHAVALSRASGLWASMKIVTEVADGSATLTWRRA